MKSHDPSWENGAYQDFIDKIGGVRFPCVGAKFAIARAAFDLMFANDLTSAWNDVPLILRLINWSQDYSRSDNGLRTFGVIFKGPSYLDEVEFERVMWERLQSIADKDVWLGQMHDDRVSADASSSEFCLSLGAQGYFVVGLRPRASRLSRRFAYPTLIFNLHDQFQKLRRNGKYDKMRRKIIDRDIVYSGSNNAMLTAHGEGSPAKQFSGRQVEAAWQCPFRDPRL